MQPASTNQAVKIGLIGCGHRLKHLAGLLHDREAGTQFVGIFDTKPASIEAANERLDSELTSYESAEALCANPEIDWVMIGSPNTLHREHAVAALDAGKHVFCEKPLATTMDDCLAIAVAAKQSGKHFSFGLTLRYAPFYRKVRELLDDNAIGTLISFEFNETIAPDHGGYIHRDWRRHRHIAGTHLLEKCCHDIDIALWLTDARPMQAASFGGCRMFTEDNRHLQDKIGAHANGRRAFEGWDCDTTDSPFNNDKSIIDHQVAILSFDNGVKATFHANCSATIPERRLYLLGTEGVIRGNLLEGHIEYRPLGHDATTTTFDTTGGGHGGGDAVLIDELLQTMHDNAPPAAGIAQGLASAATCFGMDEALDTGQVINLKPYWDAIDGALR